VTDGCSASIWFSMKSFQFECWITRKQFGTTSTSPSGARSHMSSNATMLLPRNSFSEGPEDARLASLIETSGRAALLSAIRGRVIGSSLLVGSYRR